MAKTKGSKYDINGKIIHVYSENLARAPSPAETAFVNAIVDSGSSTAIVDNETTEDKQPPAKKCKALPEESKDESDVESIPVPKLDIAYFSELDSSQLWQLAGGKTKEFFFADQKREDIIEANKKIKDNYKTRYPLHYWAMHEDVDKVKDLLNDVKTEVNKVDSFKSTALHSLFDNECNDRWKQSLGKKSVCIFKALLDAGADASMKDEDGYTAFQRALYICGGYTQHLVEIGIASGVDIPLRCVVTNPKFCGDILEVCSMLINNAVDKIAYVNAQNSKGETALTILCNRDKGENVKEYKDLFPLLIESGADVNLQDNNGKTPLEYIMQFYYSPWPFYNSKAEVKLLIESRKDKNTDEGYYKAFLNAILVSHWERGDDKTAELCKMMIEGVKDNICVNNDISLFQMTGTSSLELFKLLIDRYTDLNERSKFVNMQNQNGDTALHFAVRNHNFEQIKVLLNNGADWTIKNNKGHSSYDFVPASDENQRNQVKEKLRGLFRIVI